MRVRTRTSTRHRSPVLYRLAGGLVITILATLGVAGLAAADPSPIDDYASYPPVLPAGCPEGAAALEGLEFSTDRGHRSDSLARLPVQPGDTVTMTWSGWADGCTDANGTPLVGVSLAQYAARTAVFDPTTNDPLVPGFAYCGPEGDPCTADGLRLLVGPTPTCFYQFDAILGPPLATVGPDGSFYSQVLRRDDGPTMLVGAKMGETTCESAVAPVTAPTVTPPPGAAPAVEVVMPPAPSPPAPAAPAPAAKVSPATAAAPTQVAAAGQTLPATGADSLVLASVAVLLVATGAAMTLLSRRALSA